MAEVDVKNKIKVQERCSKIFGKAYKKTREQKLFLLKQVSACSPATLFQNRLMDLKTVFRA